MVFLHELWIPIVLSAGLCFVASALAWTVFPHHKHEWRRLPGEQDVLDVLRRDPLSPGLYLFPYMLGADLNRADMRAELDRGPVGYLAIKPAGRPNMIKSMVQMVVFFLVVSTLVAYVAWNAGLKLGAPPAMVFRIAGIVASMAYIAGALPESVWFGRPWRSWGLQFVDGLVYGGVTGAAFAWLWPI